MANAEEADAFEGRHSKNMLLSGGGVTGSALTLKRPGPHSFAVAGTFGGASVGLQMMGPDNVTWISITDDSGVLALTAAGARLVYLPAGQYRALVTGGAGAALFASLDRADI